MKNLMNVLKIAKMEYNHIIQLMYVGRHVTKFLFFWILLQKNAIQIVI